MATKSKVNIMAVVDVIGALSDSTLGNGNLCLIDDGSSDSQGQGTPELHTVVTPGQTIQWTALAVDLQTPVEIKSITFIDPDNGAHEGNGALHRPHDRSRTPGQGAHQTTGAHQTQGAHQIQAPGQAPATGHSQAAGPGLHLGQAPGQIQDQGRSQTYGQIQGQRPDQSRQQTGSGSHRQQHNGGSDSYENLELAVWSGVVPYHLTPGVPYRYRLEFQMYEGSRSTLYAESAALVCKPPQS